MGFLSEEKAAAPGTIVPRRPARDLHFSNLAMLQEERARATDPGIISTLDREIENEDRLLQAAQQTPNDQADGWTGFRSSAAGVEPATTNAPALPVQDDGLTIGKVVKDYVKAVTPGIPFVGTAKLLYDMINPQPKQSVMKDYVAPEAPPQRIRGPMEGPPPGPPRRPTPTAPMLRAEPQTRQPVPFGGSTLAEVPGTAARMFGKALPGIGEFIGDIGSEAGIPGAGRLKETSRVASAWSRDQDRAAQTRATPIVKGTSPSRIDAAGEAVKESLLPALAQTGVQLPGVLASLLARSPMPMMASMGAQIGPAAYSELRSKGHDIGEAFGGAVAQVAAEIVPEGIAMTQMLRVPIGRILNGSTQERAQALAYVAKTAGTELGTEELSTTGDWLVRRAMANPDATLAQLAEEWKQTAAQMAVQGPLMGASARAMRAAPGMAQAALERVAPETALGMELRRAVEGTQLPAVTPMNDPAKTIVQPRAEIPTLRPEPPAAPPTPAPPGQVKPQGDGDLTEMSRQIRALITPEQQVQSTLDEIIRGEQSQEQPGLPNLLHEFMPQRERARKPPSDRPPQIVMPEDAEDETVARWLGNDTPIESEQIFDRMGPVPERRPSDPQFEEEDAALSIERADEQADTLRAKGFEVRGNRIVGAPPEIDSVQKVNGAITRMTNLASSQFTVPEDANWYADVGRVINEYSHGDEVLKEKLTRLVAKLSQAQSVGGNAGQLVKAAYQIARGEMPAAGRFPNQFKNEIAPIMSADHIDTDVPGVNLKLRSFYRNIYDEVHGTNKYEDDVTIDRHMYRLIFGQEEKVSGGATQYEFAKKIVRAATDKYNATHKTNLKPRQVQALLWGAQINRTSGAKGPYAPARNYSDYIEPGETRVTAETVPSTQFPEGVAIKSMSMEEKRAFTERAYAVVRQNGQDQIAEKLGLPLYRTQFSDGAYENDIQPNVITGIIPEYMNAGKWSDKQATLYSLAWQFIYRQDSVPWFRPDPSLRAKPKGSVARGYTVEFAADLTPETEASMLAELNKAFAGVDKGLDGAAGFTKIGDRQIAIINYRDKESGQPWAMKDAVFDAILSGVINSHAQRLGITGAKEFGAETYYEHHDWSKDATGQQILQRLRDAGRPDIQGWLRDRQAEADAIAAEHSGVERLKSAVGAGQGDTRAPVGEGRGQAPPAQAVAPAGEGARPILDVHGDVEVYPQPRPSNHTWGSLMLYTDGAQNLDFTTRREINGIRRLNSGEKAIIAKAVGSLIENGHPQAVLTQVDAYVVYHPMFNNAYALYWPENNVVGIREDILADAVGTVDGMALLQSFIAHETGHATDRVRDADGASPLSMYQSQTSERLGITFKRDADGKVRMEGVGDLSQELIQAYRSESGLESFFSYPVAAAEGGALEPMFVGAEMVAQVSALYAVNHEAVRQYLPSWYQVMEATYGSKNKTGEGATAAPKSLADARARLQAALQDVDSSQRVERVTLGQPDRAATGGENKQVAVRGPPRPRMASGVRPASQSGAGGRQNVVRPTGNAGVTQGGRGWSIGDPDRLTNVLREWQNNKIDLKNVQAEIGKVVGALPEQQDAYLAEEVYHDRVSARVKRSFDTLAKPLLNAIKDSGLTVEEAGRYLWARHAPERNKQMLKINPPGSPTNLSGMYDNAREAAKAGDPNGLNAFDEMARLRAKAKPGTIQRIEQTADAITKATRDLLVSSGLEEQATINAWGGAYKHYVPLLRDAEDEQGSGAGFTVAGDESKRAMGSQQEAQAIIAALIAQHERAITRAEKARVGRALVKLAEQNPNPAFWKVDTPPKKRMINPTTGLVQNTTDPMYRNREDVFLVKEPGPNGTVVERVIAFNPDNETAMKLAAAMRNLDVVQIDGVTKMVGKVTRVMASLATSWNPLFWSTNFLRDVQTAAVNLQSTPLNGHAPQVMANIPRAMAGIASAEFRKGTGRWATLYNEFKDAGGKMEWISLFNDLVERQKQLESEIRSSQRGAANPLKWAEVTIDMVEKTNAMIENATRLSAFAEARKMGMSPAKAASLAKNLTVNFRRKGNRSTAAGSWFMFFNANVQGTARMFAGLAKSPKAQAMVGLMVTFGAVLELLNRMMGEADKDEDENNRYELIPEYIKQRNMIFYLPGGKQASIPLPYGFNVFHNAGRMMMEAVLTASGSDLVVEKKKPLQIAGNFASVVLDAFMPLGQATTVSQFVTPTIGDPFVQYGENKTWYGAPMRPEPFPGQGEKPNHKLYFRGTSDTAKDLTRWLSDISGGDNVKGGSVDVSPTTLMHVFSTATGGTGRFVLGMFDFSRHTVGRITGEREAEDMPWRNVPFVGKFYGDIEDRDVAAKFYRLREPAKNLDKLVKDYKKEGEDEKAMVEEERAPALAAFAREINDRAYRKASKEIAARYKEIEQLPREERARERRALASEEATLMGQAIRAYNQTIRENRGSR